MKRLSTVKAEGYLLTKIEQEANPLKKKKIVPF